MGCNECSLKLSTEWDKKFELSDKVSHKKVTFHNRFGIPLAGDYTSLKSKKENYQL